MTVIHQQQISLSNYPSHFFYNVESSSKKRKEHHHHPSKFSAAAVQQNSKFSKISNFLLVENPKSGKNHKLSIIPSQNQYSGKFTRSLNILESSSNSSPQFEEISVKKDEVFVTRRRNDVRRSHFILYKRQHLQERLFKKCKHLQSHKKIKS